MMFGWIFIVLIVILAIWYFMQGNVKIPGITGKQDSALDILKKRYAKGEISKEEYEEQKQTLEEEN
jgi:putative membrane protein